MRDYVGYDVAELRAEYRNKIAAAGIGDEQAARLLETLDDGLAGYTYFADDA